jgi:glycosyltransferase EpsD
MQKILLVATVEIHIIKFHIPYLKYFWDMGWTVHVACAAGVGEIPYCHKRHDIPFTRNPFSVSNIRALSLLKKIIKAEGYGIIHTHTPVGGVIGRLSAKKARKKGTKVIYTAHGFQFYNGCKKTDKLIYYNIEKHMAKHCDVLITINREDYDAAIKGGFKAGSIEKINGIGLDISRFDLPHQTSDVFTLLCVGEMNKNKNQAFLLDVLKLLDFPVKLLFAGDGVLFESLKKTAPQNTEFLGYRTDIPELMSTVDVVVSASLREGLGFNVLEAMASALPVVVTDNRGHRELVTNGVNGFTVEIGNRKGFAEAIKMLYNDRELCLLMGQAGREISKDFSLEKVMEQMIGIYGKCLDI